MAKYIDSTDADRFLSMRGGIFHYKRRVPAKVADLDDRSPIIRLSLKTRSREEARKRRDAQEIADDRRWAFLILDDVEHGDSRRFQAVTALADALGFTYRATREIFRQEDGNTILRRLVAIEETEPGSPEETALLGGIQRQAVTVTQAFKIYCDKIVADVLVGKSDRQRKDWKKVKQRAITNFTSLVGDKSLEAITRDDATNFYSMWARRVAPKEGKPTHSASSGNRDIGNMRVLFGDYFKFIGVADIKNPFDGLVFSEKIKRSRPPFPTAWIKDVVLKDGTLDGMNTEARGVILAMIETGGRPSEICNLGPENIILNDPIPHIMIEPRLDPDDPREIKTVSSIRVIPLVGIAHEVFKLHPNGFPRYRNKETHMSNALNKFFRENNLFPTPKHKIYSFRHSFEDRMKVAGFDTELRMMLMGHSIDRPKYGAGGTLEWKRNELLRIALPFEPSLVSRAQVRNKRSIELDV